MKKVLLLAVAAIMSLCINAQGIQTLQAPMGALQKNVATSLNGKFQNKFQNIQQQSKRLAKHKAELAANERLIGLYTTDDYSDNGLGLTGLPGTYEVVTVIPNASYSKLDGKLKAIRFALAQSTKIQGVRAYSISSSGSIAPIAEVEFKSTAYPVGWSTVELTEPIDLPSGSNDLMLGFTYEQTSTNYPLSVIGGYTTESFLLYGDLGDGEGFYDFSSYGALSVQGIVECTNLPKQDIILEDIAISSSNILIGSTFQYGFSIYNYGTDDVESCEVEVRLDGNLLQTVTEANFEGGITHSPIFLVEECTLPADIERGEHTITVELTKLNGTVPTENTYDDKLEITFGAYTNDDVVARQKYLVEEMTSHSCTYCPLGAKVLEAMLNKSNDLAVTCIHGNQSSKDPYNTTECQNLLNYLGCMGFPSATFNRIYLGDEDGLAPSIGYSEQYTTQAADMFLEILQEYSMPSFASVKIGKQLSEDNSTLSITVSGKGNEYASQLLKDYSLTVYVLEDSLKYRQLNNGKWVTNYIHNHVLRKVATAINGDDINWTSGSEYSNTFTVDLNSAWVLDHLSIVAFISKRQPLANPDLTSMDVTNANKVDVMGSNSDDEDGNDDGISEKIDAGLLITTMSDEVQLMGEGLSPNAKYVAGMNYATYYPAIWNTETGELKEFSDYEEGTLHAVSNNGIAVGSTGGLSGKALIASVDGTARTLPDNAGENSQGSEAYCISADGSMAAGYYFYFAYTNEEQTEGFYAVYPCTWQNDVCTTLPYPSSKDMGFSVDGAGIRWMSQDGKVLLGYLIDNLSTWPAVIWRQNENGGYDCEPICKDYFEMGYQQGKPYMLFTPTGISPNGEWVALNVQEEYDDWNWDVLPSAIKAARYNLKTSQLEVLNMDVDMNSTSITNDGTVLAYTAADGMVGRVGYLWPAGEENAICLDDEMNRVQDMPIMVANTPCTFAEDGTTIQGFGLDSDANIFTYVLNLANMGISTGIEEVKEAETSIGTDAIYNLAGQRVMKMQKGLYIIGGKKIMK